MEKKEKKMIKDYIKNNFEFVEEVEEEESMFEYNIIIILNSERREVLRNIENIKYHLEREFNRKIILLYGQIADIIAEDDIPLEVDMYIGDMIY